MNKKIIIWDFDGPIIDSRSLALEFAQFQFFDVDENSHKKLFNGNIFEKINKLKKRDVLEDDISLYLKETYWPKKYNINPFENIEDVIKTLSSEFIMVINSSSNSANISKYLERHNLSLFFKKIYGNEEIKSKKDKFELILREFNVSSKNCIFITDTLGDVLEAKFFNLKTIVVLWGYQTKEYFKEVEDFVYFVDKPSDIIDLVYALFE
jgi:phosphoglycolate phosphatase-like HAD superfamily hydrolase